MFMDAACVRSEMRSMAAPEQAGLAYPHVGMRARTQWEPRTQWEQASGFRTPYIPVFCMLRRKKALRLNRLPLCFSLFARLAGENPAPAF